MVFLKKIRTVLLGTLLPLLFSQPSWSQDCTKRDIQSQIKLFAKPKQVQLARQAVLQCGEAAIAPLVEALSAPETAIRVQSAASLGTMGAMAQDAVPALVAALADSEEKVHTEAASSLIQIGRAMQQQIGNSSEWNFLKVQELEALNKNVSTALTKLTQQQQDWPKKKNQIQDLRLLQTALQNELRRRQNRTAYQLLHWLEGHLFILVIGLVSTIYLIGLPLCWFVLLKFRPLSLLSLSNALKPYSFNLEKLGVSIPLSLRFLLLVEFFHRRSDVLDAWVEKHLAEVKSRFLNQPTVSDRQIHIPILVKLNTKKIPGLAPQDLDFVFRKSPACLVIVGEGGVGKTSLAYQIARWGLGMVEEENPDNQPLCSHRMLPVLIEQELESKSLLEAIAEQLPLTPEGDRISDELLKALLKRQRILLLLDHVSEISDQTYSKLQEALTKTPVNALIITSRLRNKDLGRPHQNVLEPQKIEGASLSTFIQPYLEARGKRDIFEDDAEFYRTCTRLASMMAKTLQSATALLVRMYVDQVIEVGGLKTAQLPDNIPDLMLKYLEWLNRPDAIDRAVWLDHAEVLQAAQAIAWECLKDNYYPAEANYEAVIRALKTLSQSENPEQEARNLLTYLEQTLRLVQRSANRVKVILDPVAEYLAAFKVVSVCQQEQGENVSSEFGVQNSELTQQKNNLPVLWQQFFQTVAAKPDLGQIRGFLLAVRNCCEREGKKLPEGVLDELNQRANLNPEELEQARRRQRINRLIDDLYDAEPKYLGQAMRNLREEGTYAHKAIPDLLKVLKSETVAANLRVEALNALMQIEGDSEKLATLCQEVLGNKEHVPEVRVAAIKALLQLAQESVDLEELLEGYFQDETEARVVRVQAGEGLRKLGVLEKLLVVELSENAAPTIHLFPNPQTWVLELPGGIELVMVPIPGGRFWMGSPSGEGYDSERPQHQVTVSDFWMGQFLVTQAQYEAVMGRNPATFQENGRNRPVETVSWHDAIAFCQRLSELTGQEFRLPSEAEWEYACRSVISHQLSVTSEELTDSEWNEKYYQPFSFGETITTDYANYRGTDWDYGGRVYSGAYGKGPKGIFREETTEVGSFPSNAFAIYDMHGNVYEWCADHWHKNYDGAPRDGSAWLSDNENNYCLLRGGSWSSYPGFCRSAYRYGFYPELRYDFLGLRVVASSRT